MPPPMDRDTLKSMKRTDLQRICKDYGIKANLKTDALIDLLVDTIQGAPRSKPQPPQRVPSTRNVSRSSTISRLRGASSSSVIIHEPDDEDNAPADEMPATLSPAPSKAEIVPETTARPRRAKNTQYKLGVGRPTVAGGAGPRAATRSVTRTASVAQKGKRGKGSKSVKPTEAVIIEEEEPEPMQEDTPQAGPSVTAHATCPPDPLVMPNPLPPQNVSVPDFFSQFSLLPVPPADVSEQLRTDITNMIIPLQTRVQLLQNDLEQRPAQVADIDALKAQVSSLRAEVELLRPQAALIPQLCAEVQQLKEMVSVLTAGNAAAPSEKSLGKARASDELEGNTPTVVGSEGLYVTPAPLAPPGIAPILLGKRHRDLEDSHPDLADGPQESIKPGREKRRPTRKRPKLDGPQKSSSSQGTSADGDELPPVRPRRPKYPAFTVFTGPEPEEEAPPPPNDLFPYEAGSGQVTPPNPVLRRPPEADENITNHPNINFDFNPDEVWDPLTSTPFDTSLPPFTYPEPPVSPSPAAPSGGFVERAGGRIERNDLFVPIRRLTPAQPPSRPQSAVPIPASPGAAAPLTLGPPPHHLFRSTASTAGNSTADVDALMASVLPSRATRASTPSANTSTSSSAAPDFLSMLARRSVSSTEVGLQLGMSGTLPLPPDPPGAQMKRTMYGTELEGDTRFGDFGVEGVASGFWAGLTRRR